MTITAKLAIACAAVGMLLGLGVLWRAKPWLRDLCDCAACTKRTRKHEEQGQ